MMIQTAEIALTDVLKPQLVELEVVVPTWF